MPATAARRCHVTSSQRTQRIFLAIRTARSVQLHDAWCAVSPRGRSRAMGRFESPCCNSWADYSGNDTKGDGYLQDRKGTVLGFPCTSTIRC